jgi:uncharacterized protein YbjQ (UPF0145 family)
MTYSLYFKKHAIEPKVMKKILPILFACFLLMPGADVRADIEDYYISEVMSSNNAEIAVGDDILFFFGDEQHGEVLKDLGEIKTSKKTNAFGKPDEEACHWVFLSAMKALKAHAIKKGGNAVINIRSNYRNNQTSSSETFKCDAGTWVAGVALIGTIIEMKK